MITKDHNSNSNIDYRSNHDNNDNNDSNSNSHNNNNDNIGSSQRGVSKGGFSN